MVVHLLKKKITNKSQFPILSRQERLKVRQQEVSLSANEKSIASHLIQNSTTHRMYCLFTEDRSHTTFLHHLSFQLKCLLLPPLLHLKHYGTCRQNASDVIYITFPVSCRCMFLNLLCCLLSQWIENPPILSISSLYPAKTCTHLHTSTCAHMHIKKSFEWQHNVN